ncbi:shikimate kinase [Paenibacillus filicis]|uniref:Shikimate kinase n=1 Tax=Paenibacillus gyeongsangnamensis TaxID=3388067 RepID=A0ABT4Q3C0_9BACL|nr:shikimate kinase [Paenibacillus filicis]MCZ8511368.1 shikimate kinase [Paenibacillus filicis]
MDFRNIVLIGLMGTGKSTVGSKLAERLGWSYVDTDERIEAEAGMRISEIFAERGEAGFRQAESAMIEKTLKGMSQVVSTGGGAVLDHRNCEAMLRGGLVVALTATEETIIERVRYDQNRPLVNGNVEERVRSLMEARRNAYDFAHVRIDTTDVPVDAIVVGILSRMGKA